MWETKLPLKLPDGRALAPAFLGTQPAGGAEGAAASDRTASAKAAGEEVVSAFEQLWSPGCQTVAGQKAGLFELVVGLDQPAVLPRRRAPVGAEGLAQPTRGGLDEAALRQSDGPVRLGGPLPGRPSPRMAIW